MKQDEGGKGRSKADAIDLDDSSTEEEDSPPRESKPASQVYKKTEQQRPHNEVEETVKIASMSSLFGDRAQMERDRLERQQKRRREAQLPAEEDEETKTGQQEENRVSKKAMIDTTAIPPKVPLSSKYASVSETKGRSSPDIYWTGAIKVSIFG
jgi:hypothetical protein